jgi:hypothetical protein
MVSPSLRRQDRFPPSQGKHRIGFPHLEENTGWFPSVARRHRMVSLYLQENPDDFLLSPLGQRIDRTQIYFPQWSLYSLVMISYLVAS